MICTEKRMWRSLIRVEEIWEDYLIVDVVGSLLKHVKLFKMDIVKSPGVLENIKVGTRLYAYVNSGAEKEEDLIFENVILRMENET